jgi:cation diffusion facilitator family transporter
MFIARSNSPDTRSTLIIKRSAALSSLLAAFALSLLKLAAGLLTGSIAFISDAAHSTFDLLAALMTLVSVEVSGRPADEDHSYGHGKVENLSALVEVLLMLGSSGAIVYVALRRLLFEHVVLSFMPWAFAVPVLSILVDEVRSRRLIHIVRLHPSPALEAEALNIRTNIWCSAAVLFGLVFAWVGVHYRIPRLELADPIAALIVAAIILLAIRPISQQTIDSLLDAAPRQTRRDLIRELARIHGVLDVERVRVRRSGGQFFVDVALALSRTTTFQHTEQLVAEATAVVQRLLPAADVIIRTVPRASSHESLFDRVRAVAARSNVSVHEVTAQQVDGHLQVEQHVELDEKLPLRAAHDFVTALEARILAEVPEIHSILTHIESLPAHTIQASSDDDDDALEAALQRAAAAIPNIVDVHELRVTRVSGHIQATCHCTLPDDLPMEQVHDAITALEDRLKTEFPRLQRFLIHPEPATDNRR